MSTESIVIVSAARTAMGGLQGIFQAVPAAALGGSAIQGMLQRVSVNPAHIDEVIMGCVLQAGQGQAPARQASLYAKLPEHVPCSTVNKMCGSGMKAVMLAHDLLKAGNGQMIVAGGMESMTHAPYLLDRARAGYRMGHGQIKDHMFIDGLEDAYDKGKLMGVFAETTAEKYQFSRQAQDEFALTSLKRAQKAIQSGWFEEEITTVTVKNAKSTDDIRIDEQPGNAKPEKIPLLRPAFKEGGTVTAANSSSISDGAAALLLMHESHALKLGLKPLARILGHASFSQQPAWFTTAPVGAIQALLKKINKTINNIDLFEINEAFAVVTMAAMRDLDIPHDKVNIHGGACALGHPIGASGARILVTLLSQLKQHQKQLGVAALCIGGGEATAIAVERWDG